MRFVDEVVPMFNRTYELVMRDVSRSRVPVSRRKAVELRELLGF
ncbi:MAG: LytTR family transcriptional regulator DNA-binding domain-containing protein [Thermoleophilia bacterium]|nr:LytTR family transcriptional regulator DNA-binding domain-containing protein [Thermoleophilia bacterium]